MAGPVGTLEVLEAIDTDDDIVSSAGGVSQWIDLVE